MSDGSRKENSADSAKSAKNLSVSINHKHFSISLNEIINLVESKSLSICALQLTESSVSLTTTSTEQVETKKNKKLRKSHERLREACSELKSGFPLTTQNSEFDQGKIIKKVYKTIVANINKFCPVRNADIFKLKNENNETVTIIPALDIGLIIDSLTETELPLFWGHFYMMFVSAVKMVTHFNEGKKNESVIALIPEMKKFMFESGILKSEQFFNPFVGVSSDIDSFSNYDVKTMFENAGTVEPPSETAMEDYLMKTVGSTIFGSHLENLTAQLQDIKDSDVADAKGVIRNLLKTETGSEIDKVCDQLVDGIVGGLKQKSASGQINPSGLFSIAQEVIGNMKGKVNKSTMEQTAQSITGLLKDSQSTLKDMKSPDGKPIGEDLMKTLNGPMQLLEKINKGKQLSQKDRQKFMSDFSDIMGKKP